MFSIPRTPLDFEFMLFNIPVHVNGTFWLMAFLLSWSGMNDNPSFVIISMIAIFLSILVHEMGHAMAFLRYRQTSQIVLYYMGGFAAGTSHLPPLRRLVVVMAGPAAGFSLYLVVKLIDDQLASRGIVIHPLLEHGIRVLKSVNLFWTIYNLLPIFPLDGGQIVQCIFMYFNPLRGALWASMSSFLFAIPVVIMAVNFHTPFIAVFVAMYGYQSYLEYQERRRRGH